MALNWKTGTDPYTAISNNCNRAIMESLKKLRRRYGQNINLHKVRGYSITAKNRNRQIRGHHLGAATPLQGSD